jgi:hypothetical protein
MASMLEMLASGSRAIAITRTSPRERTLSSSGCGCRILSSTVPARATLVARALDLADELEQIQHVAVLLVHLGVADDARVTAEDVREQRAVAPHVADHEQISGGAQIAVRPV